MRASKTSKDFFFNYLEWDCRVFFLLRQAKNEIMGRSTVVILGIKIAAFKVTLYNFKLMVTPSKSLQAIRSIELSSAY